MGFLKNKGTGSEEFKISHFIIIVIAFIISVLLIFFIDKYRFIPVAISIVLIFLLLTVKEKALDQSFPYLEADNNSNLNKFLNAVITFIYVIINNTTIIFALLGAYVVSIYILAGTDNLIEVPDLDGSYIIQEYIEVENIEDENKKEHVILFDNKYKYEVGFLENERYTIGTKVQLNLNDENLYKVIKVEKN